MEFMIVILVAVVVGYITIKIGILIYRPFYLKRKWAEIDREYNTIIGGLEREKAAAIEALSKKTAEGCNPESCQQRLEWVNDDIAYEFEVYNKYTRCQMRFGLDFSKYAEEIGEYMGAYQAYLLSKKAIKLKAATISTQDCYDIESISIKISESKQEIDRFRVLCEECERKLDNLLANVR